MYIVSLYSAAEYISIADSYLPQTPSRAQSKSFGNGNFKQKSVTVGEV